MSSKNSILKEEANRKALNQERIVQFFASDEWGTPVESFMDEYCTIFSADMQIDSLTEKQKLFAEYKQLVNGLLDQFLNELKLSKDLLFCGIEQCAHRIKPKTFEHIMALEDFQVFKCFMVKRNAFIHSQTMLAIQKQQETAVKQKQLERAKTLGAAENKLQERDQLDIAKVESEEAENERRRLIRNMETEEEQMLRRIMELSEQEENEKQRRYLEEEEEMFRRTLLESERLAEEERLRALQRQRKEMEADRQRKEMEEERQMGEWETERQKEEEAERQRKREEDRQKEQERSERQKPSEFKIKALKKQMWSKVNPLIFPPPEKEEVVRGEVKEQVESLQQRQLRLRMQRDLLKAKSFKEEEKLQTPAISLESAVDKQRRIRNQNVLRQAANEMFNGQPVKTIELNAKDIYIQQSRGAVNSDSEGEVEVLLSAREKKKLTGMQSVDNAF